MGNWEMITSQCFSFGVSSSLVSGDFGVRSMARLRKVFGSMPQRDTREGCGMGHGK
jgi:hypothetical protein